MGIGRTISDPLEDLKAKRLALSRKSLVATGQEAWVSFVAKHDGKSRIFKRILDENGSTFIVDGKRSDSMKWKKKRPFGIRGD